LFTTAIGNENEEDAASIHAASDDSGCSHGTLPAKKRRQTKPNRSRAKKPKLYDSDISDEERAKMQTKAPDKKKSARESDIGGKTTFTVESIMASFKDTTEYGQSFRVMNSEEQKKEVLRLNKGAASEMKGAIKKTNSLPVQRLSIGENEGRCYGKSYTANKHV
jgi:hypothetical protein